VIFKAGNGAEIIGVLQTSINKNIKGEQNYVQKY